MLNEELKKYLDAVESDIDMLVEPQKFEDRQEMGEMFREFVGYDPTRFWDHQIMQDQVWNKLTGITESDSLTADDKEEVVEIALDHFDAIKPNVMLQIAQKTIKSMFDKEVTSDDLSLDLDYLMNTEIFGNSFDDEEDEDESSSLLDELNEDDDEIDDDDYEEDLVD